jgi:hypothetical protein
MRSQEPAAFWQRISMLAHQSFQAQSAGLGNRRICMSGRDRAVLKRELHCYGNVHARTPNRANTVDGSRVHSWRLGYRCEIGTVTNPDLHSKAAVTASQGAANFR